MRNIQVVDTSTGEVVSEDYTLRHCNSDESYRLQREKEHYRLYEKGRHWVAGYHDPLRELIRNLSLTEAGAVIKLLPYLRFKSEGKLIKDGKPLKQAEIQRIFKRGKSATTTILTNLSDTGVISILKEGRSNVFYISTEFHSMGSVREGERFTKIYQVKAREITDDLDLHEAGLLYKILPFFHFSEYYLCTNPNEDNPKVIKHMNREDLADAVGHEPETVSRCVAKLQSKGAILTTRSGNSVRYLVHPDVLFRQSIETDWTRSVRKLFEQHKSM